MSTAMCVLCFKFQTQEGTLGTKLATRFILCFIHEKWQLLRIFKRLFLWCQIGTNEGWINKVLKMKDEWRMIKLEPLKDK